MVRRAAALGEFSDCAGLDFDALLNRPEILLAAKANRRSSARGRTIKTPLAGTGALAALLGLEGCLPLVADPSMAAPAAGGARSTGGGASADVAGGAGSGSSIAPGSNSGVGDGGDVAVNGGAASSIPVESLLKGLPDAARLLNVISAEHGTAVLRGSVIEFTPDAGFKGPASITFSYQTAQGQTRTATSDVTVEDAPMNHDHGGTSGGSSDPHAGHDPGSSGGAVHPNDPAKAAEHMAVLDLVKVADATHIAVKSGSWFDPSTWANGEVPGDGARVVIPDGVKVAYDGESDARIFTVRVDGELDFATDRDTHLVVDTFVVAPSGALTIGTEAHPVDADVRAVITIADNGPIDVSWDPQLLSRGLVSHGDVSIFGAEKENFIRVAADPLRGATSLTLEAAPEGWQVGDRIVLTGTHLTDTTYPGYGQPRVNDTTEDEVLVITRIEGNKISFDHPLQYDHEGARADLKAIVADYSRNIRIESENGAATPVHERGHVMFMHSDNIDVRYAEFFELGRTDKSERAFDVADLTTVESDSNVKGRYALHIHRAGVDDPAHPAEVVGNSVWGSPGWGFVQHDSNAILAGNAAYNVFGAAYVAETGNEIGRWVDNISIKTLGVETENKDGADVIAGDLGRSGVGFWFQGRLVEAVDNVAASAPGGYGFVYMSRGSDDHLIKIDPDTVQNGDKLRYQDLVYPNEPNISVFRGNEAFGVWQALQVIKSGPQQHDDVRSLITDFTGWEIDRGVNLQYTAHYTFTNLDLTASDRATRPEQLALEYFTNVFDIVLVGGSVAGFDDAIRLFHDSLVNPDVTDFGYYFIDVAFNDNDTLVRDFNRGGKAHVAPRFLTAADLHDGPLDYHSTAGDVITSPANWRQPAVELTGVKSDSIGSVATSTDYDPFRIEWSTVRGAAEQNGYWHLQDGRLVTVVEEYVADRVTGNLEKFALWVTIPTEFNFNPTDRPVPVDNGLLDLSNTGPVTGADFATVKSGHSVVIDVLANDRDPEGDPIHLDEIFSTSGHVVKNDDGTVTYFADPGFAGEDSFYYWAQDDQGNFTKQIVTVTVDA